MKRPVENPLTNSADLHSALARATAELERIDAQRAALARIIEGYRALLASAEGNRVLWNHGQDAPRPLRPDEIPEAMRRTEAAIAYALHETDIPPHGEPEP